MKRLTEPLINLVNLRSLIALVAAWLCLAMPLPQWFDSVKASVDQGMFRLAMDFSALPSSSSQITVVHVSPVEYDAWLADIPGAERLELLFDLALNNPEHDTTVVGLVLERPLSLIQSQAEAYLTDIQQGRRSRDHLYNEVNKLIKRREHLVEVLQAPSVVLGVEGRLFGSGDVVLTGAKAPWVASVPNWLQRWLWPEANYVTEIEVANPVFDYAPIWQNHTLARPLVVEADDRTWPGFELLFLQAAQNATAQAEGADQSDTSGSVNITWLPGQGFKVGSNTYQASVFGEIIPLYGSHSNLRSALRQLSLDAALASESLGSWVLIGRDGSATLEQLAQNIAAMADGAQIVEPLWWSPVKKFIIALLAALMCFVLPNLSRYWKMISCGVLLLCIALMALLAQSIYQYWLPVAELLLFILFSFGVINLWQKKNSHLRALEGKTHETLLQLADQFTYSGHPEQALDALSQCKADEEVLHRLYDLAETFTEQNKLSGAISAFSVIKKHKRRFKDVPAKIKELQQKLENQELSASVSTAEASDFGETQVLTGAGAEPPKLGRYEIKSELGRGANGTVFLGYDPTIAREVAIKTLHYQQYENGDLNIIKERFFKEARAVGRLTHPNIVQVYDMGEEDSLAYMTMDYARGKPLSEFIGADDLLPIAEVYRVVHAVAEALSYAHQNHVVHRDIKPSNIIYQQKPFQVRVTDFGIARLIDHSQTTTGEILGSPLYMSPEQLRGDKVNQSSDIFSLGVTFYQLLTGYLPFQGDNIANLSYAIIHAKHLSVRRLRKELPTSATRITNMALQKKPEHRFNNAADFADSLKKALKRDFGLDT